MMIKATNITGAPRDSVVQNNYKSPRMGMGNTTKKGVGTKAILNPPVVHLESSEKDPWSSSPD